MSQHDTPNQDSIARTRPGNFRAAVNPDCDVCTALDGLPCFDCYLAHLGLDDDDEGDL